MSVQNSMNGYGVNPLNQLSIALGSPGLSSLGLEMGLDVNRPDSCTEAPAAALPVGKCKRAKVEAPPPEALPPMPSKEQQIVTDVVPTLDVDSLMPIAGAFSR